jgi:lysophospholipid acyltransferase (LPLAT)-like uncharacterized protein
VRLMRSDWIVWLAGTLVAGYLKLVYATMRFEIVDQAKAQMAWADERGCILCLWHALSTLGFPHWRYELGAPPLKALVSLSREGEFMARVMVSRRIGTIRGSSRKKGASSKNKNAEPSLREMIRWVRGGNAVSITPDGPRGPAEVMTGGAAAVSRLSGAPILMMGLAASPCLRLNTWDRTVIPLPFSRAALVWDGPFELDPEESLEAATSRLQERLRSITRQAEALVAD